MPRPLGVSLIFKTKEAIRKMEMVKAELKRSDGEDPHSAEALLREFLLCGERVRSERALALLFSNHAEPQVRRTLRRRLAAMGAVERQDLGDLCSHVLLNLLGRLRRLEKGDGEESIEDFMGYVTAMAYRGYSDYLRWKYPRRHRMKTQLRQMFRSDHRLELSRTSQNEWICGLAHQQGSNTVALEQLRGLSGEFVGARPPKSADFIVKLLKRLDARVELDDLVGFVTELWGLRDSRSADLDEATQVPAVVVPAGSDVIDVRKRLETLWAHVGALPIRQRHALLLNLRDGERGSALTLLTAIGIASILDIADVLEMTTDELRSIWEDLPMDDLRIAMRLGLTRQQVINLRKSARARLARRGLVRR